LYAVRVSKHMALLKAVPLWAAALIKDDELTISHKVM
jgi:hypothetical protein